VFLNNASLFDLSEFEKDGWLHLNIYVDKPDLVRYGQFEFTSSGTADVDEYHFGEFGASITLKSGWNSIDLCFADLTAQGGEPDMSAVNYLRVYFGVGGGAAAVGISNIYVYHKPWPAPDPRYSAVLIKPYTDAELARAYTNSLIYTGSDGNKAAIAAVLEKARNGGPITFVTLGDSGAVGAATGGSRTWASLVRKWLAETFPSSTVTLVDSGIDSTDGVFGVCRMDKDVLAHNPDLVIVDFGTNDHGQQYGQEAYEGIVAKLLSRGIPLINLNGCQQNGKNIQALQIPINQRYGVPQISFKSAFQENLADTVGIKGLTAGELWSSDNIHLSTAGHRLISYLVTSYLQKEIIDAGVKPGRQSMRLPEPVTANCYADAVLIENTNSVRGITITLRNWTADYSARISQLSTEGWQAAAFDSTLTFNVNCGVFEIFFACEPAAGNLEIRVDGKLASAINFAYQGTGYIKPYHIIHFDNPGAHTITLTLKKNSAVSDPWFGICAVGAARF
jgi:lysophospholipase L1-like esterase